MTDNPKPKRRWMPVLLTVSLALNLLIVGVVLGTTLRLKGHAAAKGPPGFGPALYRALPAADRKQLRGDLSGLHRQGSKHRSEGFDALNKALSAVPFEPEALQSLLQKQAKSSAELQAALQQQWLAVVTAMSDEERSAYAARLQEEVERRPKHHKKRN